MIAIAIIWCVIMVAPLFVSPLPGYEKRLAANKHSTTIPDGSSGWSNPIPNISAFNVS
jgi:hypothetical protein